MRDGVPLMLFSWYNCSIRKMPRVLVTPGRETQRRNAMSEKIIPPTKQCTKCGEKFPATSEYFNKNIKSSDGLHPNCKACRRKYREMNADHIYLQKKNWRDNNPEKEKLRVDTWIENNKDHYLSTKREYYEEHKDAILSAQKEYYEANKEYINARNSDSYQKNKSVIRVKASQSYFANPIKQIEARSRSKKWREDNPEEFKAAMKRHTAIRRARERKVEGCFTNADLFDIYKKQNGRCAYCSSPINFEQSNQVHLDHIIPIVLGGTNWPTNLAFACRSCNLSKGKKTLSEWEKVRGW